MVRTFGWLLAAALLCAGCASKPQAPAAASAEPQTVSEPGATAEPASGASDEGSVAEPPPPPAVEKPAQGDGRWRVSVASERSEELARPTQQKLESAGYRVTIEAADVGGTTWHRVVLPGYSRDGAHAIIPILAQEGMPNAWIVPREGTPAMAAPAGSAPPMPAPAEPTPPPPPPPAPENEQPQN